MTIGERIQKMRKDCGLTQEALADALGVTPQAVSKWENDVSCPDITLLPKLAKTLGVTTDAILSDDEPKARFIPAEERRPIDDMVLRINVVDGKDRTKINLPLILFRAMLAADPDSININIGKGKMNVDWKMIVSLIESGAVGRILEHEGEDGESVVIEVV